MTDFWWGSLIAPTLILWTPGFPAVAFGDGQVGVAEEGRVGEEVFQGFEEFLVRREGRGGKVSECCWRGNDDQRRSPCKQVR